MLARIRSTLAAADLPDPALHVGLTCQDVLDTALVLVLRKTSRNAVATSTASSQVWPDWQ